MKKQFFIFFSLIFYAFSSIAQDSIIKDGFNIYHYSSGKKSSEGFLINGEPDGYWKTFYENGVLKSEGNRKNFLLDSVWKFYSDSGKILREINYRGPISIEYMGKKDVMQMLPKCVALLKRCRAAK